MHLTIEGERFDGPIWDLSDREVDREALVAAIRGDPSPYSVATPSSGPLHPHVAVVEPGMPIRPRTALAAAGRSLGLSTPVDEEIRALEASFPDDPPPEPSMVDVPPRRDVEALRERTAELRGRIRALESSGGDPTPAREALTDAARRLSELETTRAAARQRRDRIREVRDARERYFERQDRLANRRREARAHLVERLIGRFEGAVAALVDPPADPFDAPTDVVALATVRVGHVAAPIVCDLDRFANPRAAAAWLDAPVVRR